MQSHVGVSPSEEDVQDQTSSVAARPFSEPSSEVSVMGLLGPYLSAAQLKGFDTYKYSSLDTSPLSKYVTHPFWNFVVELVPKTIAPNLITFTGWLFLMVIFAVLSYYDWDYHTTSNDIGIEHDPIPSILWLVFGILHLAAHTLDGIDGKQARRTGMSTPLGELFDHGLDSMAAILLPVCLMSVFGRGTTWGGTVYDAFFPCVAVLAGFYLSHWEKYITGVLYLPWLYDVVQLGCGIGYILTYVYGVEFWRFHVVSGWTCSMVLKWLLIGGFVGSIPVSLYNIYCHYQTPSSEKTKSKKRLGLFEAMEPWVPFCIMATLWTAWMWHSPTLVLEKEPRIFLLTMGVLFSNICCRLIISQMTGQRCEVFNMLLIPLALGLGGSLYWPHYESSIFYIVAIAVNIGHLDYAVSVVNELCAHFNIYCFSLEKRKD